MDRVSNSNNGQNDASTSGGEPKKEALPQPMAVQSGNAPPPFLSKTYDMVDDPDTVTVISWSPTNNSFVVWNPLEFARDLLPKYFKHNNFSSFIRQLNTYGFGKVDPDRWEFANDGFLRGQKHLLGNISRQKPTRGQGNQQTQQSHGQSSSVGACVEVGKFGLEEEVERLKRDKNVLMQELVRLRQQQQLIDNQLQIMVQHLQRMEQRQQQMMSFLAKDMKSPGFLAQFVQQQNESNRRISDANKKRRLKRDGISDNERSAASDGQIVKYQPLMNETTEMLRQITKGDSSSRLDSFNNSHKNFLMGDGVSASSGLDGGNTEGRVSRVTLVGAQKPSSMSIPMPEVSQIPTMVPESIVHMPTENYLGSEIGNGGFCDPCAFIVNGSVPIECDDIAPDSDIDALLDDSTFWEDLFPVPEDIESTSMDSEGKGNEGQPTDNGWENFRHMDKLTEQMGLLGSNNNRL